jgi:hypothetical protein
MGKFGVEAGPDRKESSDQFQGLFERSGGWVRTEIEGVVFLNPPHNAQGWKFFFHRESEAGIILIIPQFYIISRMVLLDEIIFQDISFFFRIGDDGINVCHLFQHRQGLYILFSRLLEIGTHPVFDIPSLPNIEDRSLLIFKKIDTRIGR